jgi:acetyl-CoA synthetase (ADP-forming)
VSGRVIHKSDAGLVQLGLGDPAAVAAAFETVMARLAGLDAAAEGCLVAAMAAGELEMIVGARWDAQFGATVLVGAGGVLVELVEDVQVMLAPLSRETARAALRRLRAWRLLQGYRARPALDVEAVVDTLVRVGDLAAGLGEQLLELDINPLLVRAQGQGVVAVDARALLAGGD